MPIGYDFKVQITNGEHGFSPESRQINNVVFFLWWKWDRKAAVTFSEVMVSSISQEAEKVVAVYTRLRDQKQIACDEALAMALQDESDAEAPGPSKKRRKSSPKRARDTDSHLLPEVVAVTMPAVLGSNGEEVHGPRVMNVASSNPSSKNKIEIELKMSNLEYISAACKGTLRV